MIKKKNENFGPKHTGIRSFKYILQPWYKTCEENMMG